MALAPIKVFVWFAEKYDIWMSYFFFSIKTGINQKEKGLQVPLHPLLIAVFLIHFSVLEKRRVIAEPVVVNFVPGAWQMLGAWLPTYLPAKVPYLITQNEPMLAIVFFSVELLLQAAYLYFMVSVFNNKQS